MRDPGQTYDRPLEVDVHGIEVVITGPGPNGIALTAQAAAESASRLAAAAQKAATAACRMDGTPMRADLSNAEGTRFFTGKSD